MSWERPRDHGQCGRGYGISFRRLVEGIERLLVGGRRISVDIAIGSTRTPVCAMTREAAAVAATRAAAGIMPSAINVTEIQNRLRAFGARWLI